MGNMRKPNINPNLAFRFRYTHFSTELRRMNGANAPDAR
jgi:hypothetical protein